MTTASRAPTSRLRFSFRFAGPEASKSLAKLDIPVINLSRSTAAARRNGANPQPGLSMFEGTFQVAVPELAGLVAPTVVGSREKIRDPETGSHGRHEPPDRLARRHGRAARLAVRGAARQAESPTSSSRSCTTTTRRARRTSARAI